MGEADESVPMPLDIDLGEEAVIRAINERFARGSARMDRLEESMNLNTAMTSDVHEILVAARSGIEALAKIGRFLARVGQAVVRAVKWMAPVAIGVVAIYHAVQLFFQGGSGR